MAFNEEKRMEEKTYTAALVTAEHKGIYIVRLDGRDVPAVLTGKIKSEAASRLELPVVGDSVDVAVIDGGAQAVIHAVRPRTSLLVRKGLEDSRDAAQPVAANVAKVFIVMGLDGNFNIARLERMLVAAWDSGARPVVVLTKKDLCPPEELAARLDAAALAAPGARVIGLCSLTGEAREDDSRGRHTTTARQLYFLPGGGQVIDTPGIREFGMELAGGGLLASFSDVAELAAECRFGNCAHSGEPGCAVEAAVKAGTLSAERLANYHKLRRETERREAASDIRKRLESKRKLRQLGRIVRDIGEDKRRLKGG
jgi:ribosome biogenesis GTPase